MTRPEAEVAELPTDPGARLRRQREQAGLSEQQVAEQLNLDVTVVTALERDDFAALGAPVFVRGHMKRYATLVGLAADEILGAYERSREHLAQPSLIPKSREEMMPERGPSRWPWLVGGVALFLAAAGLAAYVNQHGLRLPDWRSAPGGASEEEPAAPPRAPVTAAATPAGSAIVDRTGSAAASPTTPENGPAAAGAAAALATGDATPGATASAPPPGQLSVQLRFAADSWVEIYDGSGRTVLYDLGQSGTERVVSGSAPLSLTFGNAPAVTLQVNGRPVAVPRPPEGQTVARFTLGPDGAPR